MVTVYTNYPFTGKFCIYSRHNFKTFDT